MAAPPSKDRLKHRLDARGVSREPEDIRRWGQGNAAKPLDGPPSPPSGVRRRPVRDFRRRHLVGAKTTLMLALAMALVALLSTDALALPRIDISVGGGEGPKQLSGALKIIALLTVLSLAPAILMLMTCFTRIAIVLNFARQAMGVQGMPPTQILTGLALMLTLFVMAPIGRQAYDEGLSPYMKGKMNEEQALKAAFTPVRRFMLHHTRVKDLDLFLQLNNAPQPKTLDELPMAAVVPAFVVSELTTAFHMGFLIFIPFVLLDFVVGSILMSMGMVMLPPALVSLPLKVMLFVLVDGWHLIVSSVVRSVIA